eukprot:Lankesteria_metandrocarpae@DN3036_c0_g1_i2.p1
MPVMPTIANEGGCSGYGKVLHLRAAEFITKSPAFERSGGNDHFMLTANLTSLQLRSLLPGIGKQYVKAIPINVEQSTVGKRVVLAMPALPVIMEETIRPEFQAKTVKQYLEKKNTEFVYCGNTTVHTGLATAATVFFGDPTSSILSLDDDKLPGCETRPFGSCFLSENVGRQMRRGLRGSIFALVKDATFFFEALGQGTVPLFFREEHETPLPHECYIDWKKLTGFTLDASLFDGSPGSALQYFKEHLALGDHTDPSTNLMDQPELIAEKLKWMRTVGSRILWEAPYSGAGSMLLLDAARQMKQFSGLSFLECIEQ